MDILNTLTTLYGTDVVNTIIKVTIEVMGLLLASTIGSLIRGWASNNDKDRYSGRRSFAFALLSTVIMFMFSIQLNEFLSKRFLFGITVLFSIAMPIFIGAFHDGSFFIRILEGFQNGISSFADALSASVEKKKKEDSKNTDADGVSGD